MSEYSTNVSISGPVKSIKPISILTSLLTINGNNNNNVIIHKFPNKSPKQNDFDLSNSLKIGETDHCVPASSMKFDPNTFANSPPNHFMENLNQRMIGYYASSIEA